MPDAVRVGNDCLPDNPSVGFADTSLYTREAFRCGGLRADEGIGPYNEKIFKLR